MTNARAPRRGAHVPGPYETVQFCVYGHPHGQGSHRAFVVGGRAHITESDKGRHAVWRDAVVVAAARERRTMTMPLDGPLQCGLTFRFAMAASRPKWVRDLRIVPFPSGPDLDKLVRCVADGLQAAGLITNDARICRLIADKVEVADSWTGCEVTVGPLVVGSGARPPEGTPP